MNRIIKSLRLRLRDLTDPYFGRIRQKKLYNKDFTIISNNCWAGSVYRRYNLPYKSPTVGLYFFADDYVRFVSNLREYFGTPLCFISANEARHKKQIIENNRQNVPIARLGDVEIVFLHYHSEQEAEEKWKRRVERINWDNIIVKFSEMNNCHIEEIMAFDKINISKKVVFVTKDYKIESQIIFRDSLGKYNISDDTTLFNSYFDLLGFLNTGKLIQK